MIPRQATKTVQEALRRQAAVALIGPRQVGKTTLALTLANATPSIYLDLEDPADRAKLSDPALFLNQYAERLVVLDEIHRAPDLFPILRGLIDKGRRAGRRTGRFLLLGSASLDLLRQSGESLAGRIAYVELGPCNLLEVASDTKAATNLWVRGGYPDSFLASNGEESLAIRNDFVRTYLERDVPMFGPRLPSETLRRLWTMLAHCHGGLLNASTLAGSLAISAQTATRYVDLLTDLLLVRRLRPFHTNVKKRLVKSPKVYVRDSGMLHALLGIVDYNALSGHPIVGMSWEGFVIENLLAVAPTRTQASFYRTAAGAEVDLLLELPRGERWAIEIKLGSAPKCERGFHEARNDLTPERSFVVYAGSERYPITPEIDAIGLEEMAHTLAKEA